MKENQSVPSAEHGYEANPAHHHEGGGCGKCENCSCKPPAAKPDVTPDVAPADLISITTLATN